jgi:hypothetical protein
MSQITIPPQRAKAARRKRRPRPVRASSMGTNLGEEGTFVSFGIKNWEKMNCGGLSGVGFWGKVWR